MHLLFSILLVGAFLSPIQALQNTSLPQCAVSQLFHLAYCQILLDKHVANHSKQNDTLQAFNYCNATNQTSKCGLSLRPLSLLYKRLLIAAMTVTNAYSLSVRAQIEVYRRSNPTAASSSATISGTATPTGGGFTGYNSTTNGKFMGARSPVPFTGGSKAIEGCGVMILVGLLIGEMAVAL